MRISFNIIRVRENLLLSLAEVLVEMDNEEEAIDTLAKLDEEDPTYPRALLLISRSLSNAGFV